MTMSVPQQKFLSGIFQTKFLRSIIIIVSNQLTYQMDLPVLSG